MGRSSLQNHTISRLVTELDLHPRVCVCPHFWILDWKSGKSFQHSTEKWSTNKYFTLASLASMSHLAQCGETIITKMVCAVGFLHIRHIRIQSPARICTNTLACRVHKIMDKTSVHGCAWDHGLPLSLIFDQRVLQSGERSCTLKTNNKPIFFLL